MGTWITNQVMNVDLSWVGITHLYKKTEKNLLCPLSLGKLIKTVTDNSERKSSPDTIC